MRQTISRPEHLILFHSATPFVVNPLGWKWAIKSEWFLALCIGEQSNHIYRASKIVLSCAGFVAEPIEE